jgi:putative peptide zinc metalloprotease protein
MAVEGEVLAPRAAPPGPAAELGPERGPGPGSALGDVPRLARGTELIGEYQGSGFAEARYIVSRGDGQVVQLSELLYRLAVLIDGHRDLEALGDDLGAMLEREVTGEQVKYLIGHQLRPTGIVEPAAQVSEVPGSGEPPAKPAGPPSRPDPLLMLKYRVGLVPDRAVGVLARMFHPMFWPPVLLVMVGGFVGLDVAIVAAGGADQVVPAARELFYQPGLTLLVLALVLAAAAFHECGHVTACRYGGARPGVMGVGLYLVWPAFYSTVTDAYRLDRRGRLRTDLGGVYFNAVFMAAMSGAYLVTGAPWLLVTLVLMHIETMWQFLPSVRLDGYYILADLVGVPDLFSRLGPVLQGMVPGRAMHPRVAELKPWTRRVISLWVALLAPCLLYWLAAFIVFAPQVLPIAWAALLTLIGTTLAAARTGDTTTAALGVVQLILLVLPYAGTTLIVINLGRRLLGALRRRSRRGHDRARSHAPVPCSRSADGVRPGDATATGAGP